MFTTWENLPFAHPVSYTHLDVYKRQAVNLATLPPSADAALFQSTKVAWKGSLTRRMGLEREK